jgi:hypothetical protein
MMRPQLVVALVVEAFDGRFLDGSVHPLNLAVRLGTVGLVSLCSMPFASQIMSKRIWRDQAVLRLRGRSANWMPLSVRMVWIR